MDIAIELILIAVAAAMAFLVAAMIYRPRIASRDATIKSLERAHEETMDRELRTIREQMTAQTEKILKSRTAELEDGNKSSMESILKPLRESMDRMKDAMDKNAREHLETSTELKGKLEQAVKEMGEKTADVGAKADSLSEALTGRPKVQGCWGENFLEDILAQEGLVEGMHYTRESANEDRSRPDFVFHFKDGVDSKDLVVDSKVSLTAFVSYMNATDPAQKETFLLEHVRSVRKHIDELASKEYASRIDKSRRFADYVLMFMPIDMACRTALDKEPMLWQEAYRKGVLISTEQTIMPFLKIIHLTWNKFRQDSNIVEIVQAASDMIERVGLFYDSYRDLGVRLKAVCASYNAGINKLEDSGRSITTSARKVMKIGARRARGKELAVPEQKVYLEEDETTSCL